MKFLYQPWPVSVVWAVSLLIVTASVLPLPSSADVVAKSGVDLEAMDRSVRAQDDFYRFATGGWQDAHEIPAKYSGYSVYTEVYELVQDQLAAIVQESSELEVEPGSEAQKIRDYYASWMDEAAIEARGLDPVQPALAAIAGIHDRAGLAAVMADLSRSGVEIPIAFYIDLDPKDSTRHIVGVYQSGLTLPDRDYYLDLDNEDFAKAREALIPFMAEMLVFAGKPKEEAAAAAQTVYEFEAALAEAQWSNVDNRDPDKTYNLMTLSDDSVYGTGMWAIMLASLGAGEEAELLVNQPSFAEAVTTMMAETPLSVWKDYLTYQLIDGASTNLTQDLDEASFAFHGTVLSGTTERQERWRRGLNRLNGALGEALGKLYVERHFPPEAKAEMERLVDAVTETFARELQQLEWMTPETRAAALEKLGKFRAKIGYPDVWKDYSTLEIVAGDHFGNVMRANAYGFERELAKLGQPADPNEWFMTPQTVNAYYNPSQNEIVFPAARLQPPFFQLDADPAINFGAVGGVIGHEISHGFDDQGSKYDGDGNLRDWWTDEDRGAFEERTARLIEQYSAFEPLEGIFINGELTLGENIGDLSGVTMAYKAYVHGLGGDEAPVIDGFSGEQRFFMGYATSRRGKRRRESMVRRIASDPHSPLPYRVNGIYPNIDGFVDAFDVEEGDGMFLPPSDRVKLW